VRALVTGIAGQDGSLLTELLQAEGHEVVGLVRRDPEPGIDGVALVRGDLMDPESLRRAVVEVRPDWIFHYAAPSYVPASWDHPVETFTAIASATAVLLDAAASLGVDPHIYVASSAEIFGDAGVSPQDERSPCRPLTPYGVAKLAAMQLARVWRGRGLHVSAGITYNHESERRPERFVTRKVTRAAAAIALGRQEELVLGDLDAVRDWSAARDVVRAARLMVAQAAADDYVLASGVGRTVRELVETAFAVVDLELERHVRVDPGLVRAPQATPPVGDPSKARAQLGWETTTSFAELIEGMVRADLRDLEAQRDQEPAAPRGRG
jgi:GDPmannose 4,6-dehydratase